MQTPHHTIPYQLHPPTHSRGKPLLLLNPLAQRRDQMANIAHGDLKREIHRRQHLREEDPPPSHGSHEPERARRDLQLLRHGAVALGQLPVGAGEDDEGHEQAEEDGDEDEVGAERADEVDEAHEAHEEEEET